MLLYSTLTRILTALAVGIDVAAIASVHAAEFVDRDMYMKHVALHALERISTFRAAHDDLTESQAAALDLLENVVRTFDINSVQDAEDACVAAFGRDECRYFSAQPAVSSAPVDIESKQEGGNSELAARAPDCKCATLNNWCDSQRRCISHRTVAYNYASYGCGTVWIYPCDGRCAEGTGGGGWRR